MGEMQGIAKAPWRQLGRGVLQAMSNKQDKMRELQAALLMHIDEYTRLWQMVREKVGIGSVSEIEQAMDKASQFGYVVQKPFQDYLNWLRLQEEARQILKLVLACESPTTQALQNALSQAQDVGLPSEDIRPVQQALEVEEARNKTRGALEMAISAKEPAVSLLEDLLKQAESVMLSQAEMEPARTALALAERRTKAREALQDVLTTIEPTVSLIQKVLEQAETAQLEQTEIYPARKALALAEARAKARDALQAVLSADVPTITALQQALVLAEAAKLPQSEIEPAKKTLILEEIRATARDTLHALLFVEEPAVVSIQEALRQAEDAGLAPIEIEPVRKALAEAEQRVKARDALQVVLSAMEPTRTSLEGALELAKLAKLPQVELEPAWNALALAEDRIKARDMLSVVLSADALDVVALKHVLQRAEVARLPQSEIEPARRALELEEERDRKALALEREKCTARDALHVAVSVEEPILELLREALTGAENAQLSHVEMEPARKALTEAEQRAKARHGLNAILSAQEPLVGQLQDALSFAEAVKLSDHELQPAREALALERIRLKAKLDEARQKVRAKQAARKAEEDTQVAAVQQKRKRSRSRRRSNPSKSQRPEPATR